MSRACATGRKYLRGPRGSGFLFVDSATASIILPSHVDHECAPITRVPFTYPENPNAILEYQFRGGAKRFGFYESSAAIKLGFGEAVRYALEDAGGMAAIAEGIAHNMLQMQKRLEVIEKVQER